MCVSSRPTMQHPMVSLVYLSTQTLWTSMMVSCQTSMRRILTHGTCRPLVWREVVSEATMETCSHPTWLPKVTSDFNGTQGSRMVVFFLFLLPVYFTTVALWLQYYLKVGIYNSYIQPKHTYKDKVRLFSIILF